MTLRTIRIALFALLFWPASLRAHTKLMSSQPAAGSLLKAAPSEVRLVFNERPSAALASVRIVAPDGDTLVLRGLRVDRADPRALIADVPSGLGAGDYSIAWRVAGSDGHPRTGTIAFRILGADTTAIAPGSLTAVDTTPLSGPPGIPTENESGSMAVGGAIAAVIARWVSFLATFLVIGVVAFRFGVLGRLGTGSADAFMQIASSNAATLGIGGAVAVVLSAALKLARESADMPDVALTAMLFGSSWGLSILLQMVAAATAAAAFRAAQAGTETARANGWRAAMIAAAVLAVTPALGGHAASGEWAFIAIPLDAVHVAAGSVWLGSLAVIVIVGISAALKTPDSIRPGERVASLINTFSPMALICGGLVVATGSVASVLHLCHVSDLWSAPYGVALSLKLLFVALLFGAGAWNWRRMKPRLTGDDAVVPMRSMATFELLLATIVLGITAILVALELP